MQPKAFIAAVLGLTFFASGAPAVAQPHDGARSVQLVQAKPRTDEEKAEEEAGEKASRKGDAKAKGAGKAAAEKDAKQRTKQGDGKAGGKAAPAKSAAPERKAPARSAAPESKAPTRSAAPEKQGSEPRQETTKQTPSRPAAKSAAPARRGDDTKAKQGAKMRTPPKARAGEAEKPKPKAAQEPARAPAAQQQTQGRDRDDDRRKSAGDRDRDEDRRDSARDRNRGDGDRSRARRNDDDDDRRRSWFREREERRTSAQELRGTEIRGEREISIDGGARTLRRENGRVVIRGHDFDRLRHGRHGRGDQRVERLPNGHTRTVVIYPDGTQVITVTGRHGEIVHRSRRDRRGHEVVLIREVRRPPVAELNLGPLRVTIPREQYIVDGGRASPRDLRAALLAPPVEPGERGYSLEEVRRFDRIRDKMRRIDITSITFATDSATIEPNQARALEELALIITDMIEKNPGELFLVEGHTDLVGPDVYNLALSDRRAEAVAFALTDYFGVPPENLVTQGYGEDYPKIPTEASERENRRVAVRRITPLVAQH